MIDKIPYVKQLALMHAELWKQNIKKKKKEEREKVYMIWIREFECRQIWQQLDFDQNQSETNLTLKRKERHNMHKEIRVSISNYQEIIGSWKDLSTLNRVKITIVRQFIYKLTWPCK